MYKLLLIEDTEADAKICQDTIEVMNQKNLDFSINLTISPNFDTALKELKNEYQGVIVDIKLDNGNSGNSIIETIIEKYRVPVAVMTGTPDTILEDNSPISIFKKGEDSYESIINSLIKSFNTGLFDVIGGKGILEKTMNMIFWKNLYPQIHTWEKLKERGFDTEKILLRYAIAHMQELIDSEVPAYVTQEMYIKPPINNEIRTGSIIKNKEDNQYYVVLSPPCDLAKHNGKMKTDRVMLCEIESQQGINIEAIGNTINREKKKKCLLMAIKNNYKEYYHWLPQNDLFQGGYINFRLVLNYKPEEILEQFDLPELHIQDYFVKDILSRFSAYYARQGQPDFDFDDEALRIINQISPE